MSVRLSNAVMAANRANAPKAAAPIKAKGKPRAAKKKKTPAKN